MVTSNKGGKPKRLKLSYQGDYAREFGAHPQGYSRKWKVYNIFDGSVSKGILEVEPEYHPNRFKLYINGTTPTTAEFIRAFESKKEALKTLQSIK